MEVWAVDLVNWTHSGKKSTQGWIFLTPILWKYIMRKIYTQCASWDKNNKPKGLKVVKEDQRLIGSMVDRLDGW